MKIVLEDKKQVFGQYDIRGIYPDEVNEELVYEVSKTLAKDFFPKGRVVVGMDARNSSKALYKEVLRGLEANGVKVLAVGLITTPMLYFLVNHLETDGGVIVTASHNPKEYNGLKVVEKKAKNISGVEIFKRLT